MCVCVCIYIYACICLPLSLSLFFSSSLVCFDDYGRYSHLRSITSGLLPMLAVFVFSVK